jgi:hypothetical protein
MQFSMTTKGFYLDELIGRYVDNGLFPTDARPVSAIDEARLRAAIQNGDTIIEDESGFVIVPKASPTLYDLKADKQATIESYRNDSISQSINSNALGAPHTYSAKAENRNFLNNLITLGIDSKFTCADANGVKERRMHTHAQLLALAHDIEAHISAQFDHYELKLAAIAAATTPAELEAITW